MKSNKTNFRRLALAVSVIFALSACDSDNDDNTPPVPPAPIPPPANSAPVVSSTAVTDAVEGVAYTYTLTASDSDAGDTITLAATSAPAWLSFDATTGILSGTPATENVGANAVTLTVGDGTVIVTQSFTITVVEANVAPIISSTALTMGTIGSPYSYTVTASDANNDTLSFGSVTLPPWGMFDTATGILSGTPDMAGDYPVELNVSDGQETVTQGFSIAVIEASNNVALTVFENTELPGWATWLCCSVSQASVVTDDADKDQVVEFTIDRADGQGGTVAGFTAREVDGAVNGIPFDASAFRDTGTLVFDLKLVTQSSGGPQNWFIKVESGGMGAQNVQLALSTSQESHAAPVLNTWQTYTFDLSDLSGTLDLSAIDLIMVFPAFSPDSDGTVFRIDNVRILEDGASTPTTPPPAGVPTDVAITLFEDEMLPEWATWTCCGVTQAAFVADEDAAKGQVTEFTIDRAENQGGTVVGYTARDADGATNGMPFDASSFTATGVLQFDLKLVTQSAGGPQNWLLKVESNNTSGEFSEVALSTAQEGHAAPVLNTWQTYTFNLSDLSGPLNQSAIDLVMIFPAFSADSDGTVFRVDNVKFFRDGASTNSPAPGPAPNGSLDLDFEADGAGNTGFTWLVFENETNPALEIVANPQTDAVNSSATVAKFTALQAGQPFAGVETNSGPTFTLDNANKIVRIAVYKTVVSDVGIKFSVGAAAQPELLVPNTKINEWEVITFDFSSYIGRAETIGITNLIVFPDFNVRTQDNVVYFDNITFSAN